MLGPVTVRCSHGFKIQAQNKSTSQDLWASESSPRHWGCCIAGKGSADPTAALRRNSALDWAFGSTLKPHLERLVLLQQVPGLPGCAVISVLDLLHQLAVCLCTASASQWHLSSDWSHPAGICGLKCCGFHQPHLPQAFSASSACLGCSCPMVRAASLVRHSDCPPPPRSHIPYCRITASLPLL